METGTQNQPTERAKNLAKDYEYFLGVVKAAGESSLETPHKAACDLLSLMVRDSDQHQCRNW